MFGDIDFPAQPPANYVSVSRRPSTKDLRLIVCSDKPRTKLSKNDLADITQKEMLNAWYVVVVGTDTFSVVKSYDEDHAQWKNKPLTELGACLSHLWHRVHENVGAINAQLDIPAESI